MNRELKKLMEETGMAEFQAASHLRQRRYLQRNLRDRRAVDRKESASL